MCTRMFPTESGQLVPLNVDGQITYIPETVKEELTIADNGFATCNGEDVRYHGRILKQTVVLQETHFTVKKVKIRCNFDSGDRHHRTGTSHQSQQVCHQFRHLRPTQDRDTLRLSSHQINPRNPEPNSCRRQLGDHQSSRPGSRSHTWYSEPTRQMSTPRNISQNQTPRHCGIRAKEWTQLT